MNAQYYTVTCTASESLTLDQSHEFVLHESLEAAFEDSFDSKTRKVTGYVVNYEGWHIIRCQMCKADLNRFRLSVPVYPGSSEDYRWECDRDTGEKACEQCGAPFYGSCCNFCGTDSRCLP